MCMYGEMCVRVMKCKTVKVCVRMKMCERQGQHVHVSVHKLEKVCACMLACIPVRALHVCVSIHISFYV